jgi:hypothetical protein
VLITLLFPFENMDMAVGSELKKRFLYIGHIHVNPSHTFFKSKSMQILEGSDNGGITLRITEF